jgi:CubicO group peptidase (beta-lactamase class C family)
MKRGEIPALGLAVALANEVVLEKGYGQIDVENAVAATAQARYRTASIAKPMTAVVALKLAEEGVLDLDAPVQTYLPEFPAKRWPLTSRHLLSHLGGVRHYGKPGEASGKNHHKSVRSALRLFADDPLRHEPGTRYLYSTYGYNLLGAVAEAAGKAEFAVLLDRCVTAPAGMTSTCPDSQARLIPHRARGYERVGGELRNAELHDTSMKVPGGGLLATAGDLARFAVAANTARLLKPETVAAMWSRQHTKDGKEIEYGQGWRVSAEGVDPKEVSHSGAQAGTATLLVLRPASGAAVALMCNLEGSKLGSLAKAILQEIDGAGR